MTNSKIKSNLFGNSVSLTEFNGKIENQIEYVGKFGEAHRIQYSIRI